MLRKISILNEFSSAYIEDFIHEKWGILLVKLQSGFLFGEKALVDNAPRAATALTMEDTELIYIEKSDFD
jgi:CRP-like cAMP-binding protein